MAAEQHGQAGARSTPGNRRPLPTGASHPGSPLQQPVGPLQRRLSGGRQHHHGQDEARRSLLAHMEGDDDTDDDDDDDDEEEEEEDEDEESDDDDDPLLPYNPGAPVALPDPVPDPPAQAQPQPQAQSQQAGLGFHLFQQPHPHQLPRPGTAAPLRPHGQGAATAGFYAGAGPPTSATAASSHGSKASTPDLSPAGVRRAMGSFAATAYLPTPASAAPPPQQASHAGGAGPGFLDGGADAHPESPYRDGLWTGDYHLGTGAPASLVMLTNRSDRALEGIAWDSDMRCFTVSGVFSYTKPHRWSLVLENVLSRGIVELEGRLDLGTRVVAGACTDVQTQGASSARQRAGTFQLRSVGNATLLSDRSVLDVLGWPQKFFDYTTLTSSDLAEYFTMHQLLESAAAVEHHDVAPAQLACCPRRQLVGRLGIPESEVDATMRSFAWLMSLLEARLIEESEHGRPLGAAMRNFNIPVTDALFGQVCGFNKLLMLSLPHLVDLLTGTGSLAARLGSAVPRFWSPRTKTRQASIANLQICHSASVAAGRKLLGKDLLLMPPQRLQKLGFDAAVYELFDYFREYLYFLKHRESILQRANTRALLCAMVSLNHVASAYTLLALDPQCIVAINGEILQTVASEAMHNMLLAFLGDEQHVVESAPPLVRSLSTSNLSDRAEGSVAHGWADSMDGRARSFSTRTGRAYSVASDRRTHSDRGYRPRSGSSDSAAGASSMSRTASSRAASRAARRSMLRHAVRQDWKAPVVWWCVIALYVCIPLAVALPLVVLASDGANKDSAKIMSVVVTAPLQLGTISLFGIAVFGAWLEYQASSSERPGIGALPGWFYFQAFVAACLLGIGGWNLLTNTAALANTFHRCAYALRAAALFVFGQCALVVYARHGGAARPYVHVPAWTVGRVHRTVAVFALATAAEFVLFSLSAQDGVKTEDLYGVWVLDLASILLFAYLSQRWDSHALGLGSRADRATLPV